MADVSGLWETVVAAFNESCAVLAPTWAAHKSIFWDHNPEEPMAMYKTLNVPIPGDPTSQVQDIGSGDLQISDGTVTTIPIVMNLHPSYAFPVRDFDQFTTPTQLRALWVDGAIKAIKNNINNNIAALFTSANFTTNTAVSCTGGSVSVTKFTGAMAVLMDQRVPITDRANMSCLLPSVPYTNMLDSTTNTNGAAWVQAFIAGEKYAVEARDTGQVPTAFNTRFFGDQQMPTSGTAPSRTFTGAYFHRWAVSGVCRPIATPDVALKSCDVMYKDWDGISLRIMLSYSHYPKLAPILSVEAGYGLKVTRENMGLLFSIAE